jgi:hypothetical protein
VFNDDFGVFGLNEARLVLERLLFFTHDPPRQIAPVMPRLSTA